MLKVTVITLLERGLRFYEDQRPVVEQKRFLSFVEKQAHIVLMPSDNCDDRKCMFWVARFILSHSFNVKYKGKSGYVRKKAN